MEQSIREIFALKERDVRQYSSLSLAFLGDSVYEMVVRTILVERYQEKPKQLNVYKKRWVSAPAQASMIQQLRDNGYLTEEEISVYHRGRNANIPTMAKSASMQEYRKATGFEALIGYLYLNGQTQRILELIRTGAELSGLMND